ncbi:cardiolipin synthase ClsB [Xanthomonas campestris]|uniref:cardiolipin synthase ClsB n=1 Tax=Xanthomonas campestris TaxID=339 RepID=UPI000E1E6530|nr:cardiolipin synthase ClsB [Xanthomonas campestris]
MSRQPALCWRRGHRMRLLENGENYFARIYQVIAAAQDEILLETFILFEDVVGLQLKQHLIDAAQRGVRVHLLVDAFGSRALSAQYVRDLAEAGVQLRLFDPEPTPLRRRINMFRRLHRKLLVVDQAIAFVGGINYSADQLAGSGPQGKQDYAIELQGPVVRDIAAFMQQAARGSGTGEGWTPDPSSPASIAAESGEVCFVARDNGSRSRSIEQAYRQAFADARQEIIIANAYFFPGYGLLRDLCAAARRGVQVRLIVQGQPDTPLALLAARLLYRQLLAAGAQVFEYCERPFHGKVSVIDGHWSTVGSSNLDPLSLALNLEANVLVRNHAFAEVLRERLQRLMTHHCQRVEPAHVPRSRFWELLTRPLLFHVMRYFPRWARHLRGQFA